MAGQKKLGDLGRVIGVRLDKPMERIVDDLAQKSVSAKGKAGDVIRVIVTSWLVQQDKVHEAFADVADEVYPLRQSFGAAAEAARRQQHPKKVRE